MLSLIIGGSGSGKSAYAEGRVLAFGGEKRIYLAAMESGTAEGQERIRRHRKMRAGKGFETVECPRGLERLMTGGGRVCPEAGADVLLEDLPNLAANEMFAGEHAALLQSGDGAELFLIIRKELDALRACSRNLVVVTGDIFSDGAVYEGEMLMYQKLLADCNRYLAGEADEVIEVVCGLPCVLKG